MKKYPIGTPVKEHRMHKAAIGQIKQHTPDGGAWVLTYDGQEIWVAGGLVIATPSDVKVAKTIALRSATAIGAIA